MSNIQGTPMFDQVVDSASSTVDNALAATQRGLNSVRGSSQQLLAKAQQATDTTVSYIKDEPVKAILIAAATGAALMALMSLMTRSRHNV